jgi:urocanate hydratase
MPSRPDLGARPDQRYLPKGWTIAQWEQRRKRSQRRRQSRARPMAEHVRAMLDFHRLGIPVVDYGNNIRHDGLRRKA